MNASVTRSDFPLQPVPLIEELFEQPRKIRPFPGSIPVGILLRRVRVHGLQQVRDRRFDCCQ
ncbi:hypothetical protein [Thalassoglobus neptunius]|uniref:hypothetical protein n=1 Tax=Thalassoglobus neptunius TaxID=1938619 RepID=UPI0011B7C2D1|nr:hypothetical protein [Thalassoglobus neptunius]